MENWLLVQIIVTYSYGKSLQQPGNSPGLQEAPVITLIFQVLGEHNDRSLYFTCLFYQNEMLKLIKYIPEFSITPGKDLSVKKKMQLAIRPTSVVTSVFS